MSKKTFLFVPEYDATIGDLSEQLHFALFKSQRLNKKIRFIRKRLFFGSTLKKIINYKQLKGIFKLNHDFFYHGNPIFTFLISFYFGLIFFLRAFIAASLFKLKLKKSFNLILIGWGHDALFNIHRRTNFTAKDLIDVDWKTLLNEKQNFSLPKQVDKSCEKALKMLGVPKNKPYICLHIRTSFFHNDLVNFRNSNITNYLEALKYLNSLGYKVIRLGDPVSIGHEDLYIDYPNTKHKSEIMDLYLIKNCDFYFGTNSGTLDTAFLLGAPVLAVNVTDFIFSKPYKSCDLFIYKHIFSMKKNRILSFKEALSEPYSINSNRDFDEFNKDYSLHENSNEEILQATKNMLSYMNNQHKESPKQILFKKELIQAIEKWVENDRYFQQSPSHAYKVMIKNYFNGRIGRDFSECSFGGD